MGLFADSTRGAVAVIVAGAALVATQPPAAARSVPVVRVPCAAAALANAITAANTTPSILQLASLCTYNLTAALPQITGDVTLDGGPSTTIRRAPATDDIRILDVGTTGTLRVQGIFILNGELGTGDGAGIRNAGILRLNRTTVSGNFTNSGQGGGVFNGGRAFINESVISANIISTGNGAGIHNNGDLTIASSRIIGNSVNDLGAGIFTAAGRTTRVIQSTISNNTTESSGGGLAGAGTTSLERTLVTFNKAVRTGGGILVPAGGGVTLRNSIVRQNSPDNCSPANSVPGCVG